MPRGILLVFTDPTSASTEADYNNWYDKIHLPDVIAVDGFTAAARYRRLQAADAGDEPAQQYLAVYEVEADDIEAAGDALQKAAATMDLGTSLQLSPPPKMMWYSEITPRMARS